MSAMRSMVMLPRGGSAEAGTAARNSASAKTGLMDIVGAPASEPSRHTEADDPRRQDAGRAPPCRADLLVLEQNVVGIEDIEQIDVRLDARRSDGEPLGEAQVDELRDVVGPVGAA